MLTKSPTACPPFELDAAIEALISVSLPGEILADRLTALYQAWGVAVVKENDDARKWIVSRTFTGGGLEGCTHTSVQRHRSEVGFSCPDYGYGSAYTVTAVHPVPVDDEIGWY